MNANANPNPETDRPAAAVPADPQKAYPPRLVFYHPNSKGTGCAVQFDFRPAASDREGCLFAAFANQKSLAAGARPGNSRQAATFNWTDKITVKLNFHDVCQLLLVLAGKAPKTADGKGLYHDTGEATTVINMARQTEPVSGVSFEVSKKRKGDSAAPQRSRILFTDAEAFGLYRLLDATLLPLAFGR
jgi:hypothetical protein